MKHKYSWIIILVCIPLLLSAKYELYERYDEDVANLFNILINYDRNSAVHEYVWEHANIEGPHINIFKKVVNQKITSYTIIENHYLNGCGMYYIYVKTEKDPYGEYFWLQCFENRIEVTY